MTDLLRNFADLFPLLGEGSVGWSAEAWTNRLWMATWSGGLVLAGVWLLLLCVARLSPRFQCWFWRLAFAKLLIGLIWVTPIAIPLLPAKPRVETTQAVAPVEYIAPAIDHSFIEEVTVPAAVETDAQPVPSSQPTQQVEQRKANPPNQKPAASTPIRWDVWLIAGWLMGMCAMLSVTLWQWWRAKTIVRESRLASSALTNQCAELARDFRLRQPRVRVSAFAKSPLLVGVFRPTLVFPHGVERQFSPAEISLMARHELAHLKRRDLLWNWLPALARIVFFFHPLVWLTSRCWTESQESACDEFLVRKSSTSASDFGRLLLKLSRSNSPTAQHRQFGLAASAVLGTYRNLERRILVMSQTKSASHGKAILAALIVSLTAMLVIAPWRLVAMQQDEPSENQPDARSWSMRLGGSDHQLGHPYYVMYSPDGSYIACAHGKTLAVHDRETGKKIQTLEFPGSHVVSKAGAISPDGKRIAIGGYEYIDSQSYGYLAVADRESGEILLRRLIEKQPELPQQEVLSLSFSADGEELVAGTFSGQVQLWNLATGEMDREFNVSVDPEFRRRSHRTAISDDGNWAASGIDGKLRLWDLRGAGRLIDEVQVGSVGLVQFLNGGRELLTQNSSSAGNSHGIGQVWSWESDKLEVTREIGGDAKLNTGPWYGAGVLSPDESLLAIASADKIGVFDFATGKLLHELEDSANCQPGGNRQGFAFSPDGKELLARSKYWEVRRWDTTSGKELELGDPNRHRSYVRHVDVTADGKLLLTVSDDRIRLWDAATGQEKWTVAPGSKHPQSMRDLMQGGFTPDGTGIIYCGLKADRFQDRRGALEVWDVQTGKLRYELEGLPYYATAYCLSADEKFGAVYAGVDNTGSVVCVFELATGEIVHRLTSERRHSVGSMRFVGDGIQAVEMTGNDGLVHWDFVAQEVSEPKSPEILGQAVFAENPSSSEALVIDNEAQALSLLDLETLELKRNYDCASWRPDWAGDTPRFSPSGKLVTARLTADGGNSSCVRVWDKQSGDVIADFTDLPAEAAYRGLTFFPDESRLLCGLMDGTAVVLNLPKPRPVQQPLVVKMRLGEPVFQFGRANALVYAPDGSFLACCIGKQITLCDPESGAAVRRIEIPGDPTIKAAAISSDGKRIAVVGEEYIEEQWRGCVACVDVSSGATLLHKSLPVKAGRRKEDIRSVAISPDAEFVVTGSSSGDVILWDLKSQEQMRKWEAPVHRLVDTFLHHVSFSPDGQHVASTSQDRKLRIWDSDAANDGPVQTIDLGAAVDSMTFLADGKRILTRTNHRHNNADVGQISIWDVESGQHVRSINSGEQMLEGPAYVSADEKFVAAADIDRIRVFDLATGEVALDLSNSGTLRGMDLGSSTMAFSPAGDRLVARGDKAEVRIWDLETGGRLLVNPDRHTTGIRFVDVSPDGQTLLTVDEHRFRLWNAKSGEAIRTVQLPRRDRTLRNLMQAGFTPDGRSVLICGGMYETSGDFRQATVEVWDVATGELRIEFGDLPWYATAACFSADGESVAVYCGYGSASRDPKNEVFVFRLSDGQILRRLESTGDFYVQGIRFRKEGDVEESEIVETVEYDEGIIAWDFAEQVRSEPRHVDALTGRGDMQVAPNQEQIMFADYKQRTLKLIHLATSEVVREFDTQDHAASRMRFSAGGKFVAAVISGGDDSPDWIRVWETATGRVVHDFKELPSAPFSRSMAFFPDERRLLCGLRDATAIVIELPPQE